MNVERLERVTDAILTGDASALPMAVAFTVAVGILAFKQRKRLPDSTWILMAGTVSAALLSALAVLKHYQGHYVVAVAAALPALVITMGPMSHQPSRRVIRFWQSALVTAISIPGVLSVSASISQLAEESRTTIELAADRTALDRILADEPGRTVFCYRSGFRERVEGFVANYSGVPEITREYAARSLDRISSFFAPAGPFRHVVIDKTYFKTHDDITRGANLEPTKIIDVRYQPGDRIIELNRVFVLSRRNATHGNEAAAR